MGANLVQRELARSPAEASIGRSARAIAYDGFQPETPKSRAPFVRILVVPEDDLFVGSDAEVELECVRSVRERSLERRDGVFDLPLGRAAVANDPKVPVRLQTRSVHT